jgi:hypothetical protein
MDKDVVAWIRTVELSDVDRLTIDLKHFEGNIRISLHHMLSRT